MTKSAKTYQFGVNEHGISLLFKACELDSLQYLRISPLNRALANATDIFVDSPLKPGLVEKFLELPLRGSVQVAVHYSDPTDIQNFEVAREIINDFVKRRTFNTEIFSVILQHYILVSHENS